MILGQLRMGARQAKNAPLVPGDDDEDDDDLGGNCGNERRCIDLWLIGGHADRDDHAGNDGQSKWRSLPRLLLRLAL